MPRKPIELERAGLRTPRERMWLAMRTLAEFSPTEIEDKAHPITRDAVCSYLDGLMAAGYVEQIQMQARRRGAPGFGPARFRVVKAAAIAPQLDKTGAPVKASMGTLAMWRAMKVRKVFDAKQLAADATYGDQTCTVWTAKSYLKALSMAGYLRIEREPTKRRVTLYRLVKDTGPLPPAITRAKVVFDRNTGELMPVETAQEVCDALDA